MKGIMRVIRNFLIIVFVLFIANFLKTSAYASDCSEVLPGGNLTLTTSCSFTGTVNGVDSGIDSTNSAVLTLEPGGILTIQPGQTIAVGSLSFRGGSIIKMAGGVLRLKTPLWIVDEDGDGYPATTIQYTQSTQPIGARRRNTQTSIVEVDGNEAYYCPDSYNPNVTCNKCKIGQLSYQLDGVDQFSQCPLFNLCNGAGQCTLHAKRAFVSSTSYTGNLGGLAGADQICQNLADSTSLNGTWKAWLSDGTTSVNDRFIHSDIYPYILVDEQTKIADNWLGLTSLPLLSTINKTELATIDAKAKVWTNTNFDGLGTYSDPEFTCNNWTNNKKMTGVYGKNNLTTTQWTNFDSVLCSKQMSLYCFEQ